MEILDNAKSERSLLKQQSKVSQKQNRLSPLNSLRIPTAEDPVLLNSKPEDFYFNQARTRFLLSQPSLRMSLKADENKKSSTSKVKPENNPVFKELGDIIPDWLTSRVDFQKSYLRMRQVEHADLENIVGKIPAQRTEDEKRALFMWVSSNDYFKKMPRIIIKDICERLTCSKFKENEKSNRQLVINQGAKADCLYILYKGTVGIYVNNAKVAHYSDSGTFGDIALDKSSPRTADAITETQAVLFVMKEVDYKNIIFNYKNIEKEENCRFLTSIPFFSNWSRTKIQLMSNSFVQLINKTGDVVYEFGDKSHVFYLLKSGKIELQTYISLKRKNRWPVGSHMWNIRKVTSKYVYPIKVVVPGNFFGEYEILKGLDRVTRAIVIEDSVCLALNQNEFDVLFNKDHENMLKMSEAWIPSTAEMEKDLQEKLVKKTQSEQVLLKAMNINCLPSGKDSVSDKRSRKMRKWLESIKTRKKGQTKQIASSTIENVTKCKIKKNFARHNLSQENDGTKRFFSCTPQALRSEPASSSKFSLRFVSSTPSILRSQLADSKSRTGYSTPLTNVSTEIKLRPTPRSSLSPHCRLSINKTSNYIGVLALAV